MLLTPEATEAQREAGGRAHARGPTGEAETGVRVQGRGPDGDTHGQGKVGVRRTHALAISHSDSEGEAVKTTDRVQSGLRHCWAPGTFALCHPSTSCFRAMLRR